MKDRVTMKFFCYIYAIKYTNLDFVCVVFNYYNLSYNKYILISSLKIYILRWLQKVSHASIWVLRRNSFLLPLRLYMPLISANKGNIKIRRVSLRQKTNFFQNVFFWNVIICIFKFRNNGIYIGLMQFSREIPIQLNRGLFF